MRVLDYLGRFVWVSNQRKQLYKITFIKHINRPEECPFPNKDYSKKVNELIEKTDTDAAKSPSPQHIDSPKENFNLSGKVVAEITPGYPWFEYVQRKIGAKLFPKAIEEVLDYYGTEDNVKRVLQLIGWNENISTEFDFRTWCGICAFAERVVIDQYNDTDSADELEKSDFKSLEERLKKIDLSEHMDKVFRIIRSTHGLS